MNKTQDKHMNPYWFIKTWKSNPYRFTFFDWFCEEKLVPEKELTTEDYELICQ